MNPDFIQSLRKESLKIKLESDLKYGGAVDFNSLIDSLKAIASSYEAYTKATFLNDLNQEFVDKEINETRKLRVDNQLLIVDLEFGSFEAHVSPDLINYNSEIPYTSRGKYWKKENFQSFQNDVLLSNFNDLEFRANIKTKFNESARRKIFKPLVDLTRSNKSIFFQQKGSRELTGLSIVENDIIYQDLIPPKITKEKEPSEEKTYKIYLKSSQDPDLFGNKLIYQQLLGVEELEKDVYPYLPLFIEDEEDRIDFYQKQQFEVTYDDEAQSYLIESEDFDLSAWGADRASAEDAFDFLFIETFKNIALEDDSELTEKAQELKAKLKLLVKEYKHKQ